jgi:hypothetical protein
MRKCRVTIDTKAIRTDAELLALWAEALKRDSMERLHDTGIQYNPNVDCGARRNFFDSNRTYHDEKRILGLFHQWGNDFIELENGPGNYMIAIVELADGSIITPTTDNIEFLPPDATGFEEFARMGHHNLGRMMF